MKQSHGDISTRQSTASGPSTVFRFVVMVTFASVFTAVTATVALAATVRQPTDPFATYADILPGQPIDVADLEERGFLCEEDTRPTPADLAELCFNAEGNEQAFAITVALWDGVVERLDLKLRDQVL